MINLLPPDVKESITFARRNTYLLNWSISLVSGLAVIVAVVFAGHLYLSKTIDNSNKQLSSIQAELKLQKVEETQKQVEDISNNLKLVIQVLSKQVLFSKLLEQIGAVMPPDTVLTNLSINKLQGGIDLQAQALSYEAATQVQVNLNDKSNKIFSSADLVSIQQSATNTSKYQFNVTVRAQFSTDKDNPFLLINNGSTK